MSNIGIFDSGIGGFSILIDLKKTLFNQNIFYVADQAHLPYSNKSQKYIIDRTEKITHFLESKNCSTIVVACNTATVLAISHLRKSFPHIKFVGVEPAIKPAAEKSKTGHILVLATKNTINSKRLKDLKNIYADSKKIYYQDLPNWVLWAEDGKINSKEVMDYSQKILSPYKTQNIDSIVLACTHYPFFTHVVEQIFPQSNIYNPSRAVARQTKRLHIGKSNNPTIVVHTTDKNINKISKASNLLPFPVKIESISL